MTKPTVASFFTGIGGIDLAFTWAGFDVVYQCEIDEYCRQVLKKHKKAYWPNARQRRDIRNETKKTVGSVDVFVGGFPCQDISIAGKRRGVTRRTRSGLWFELLRLISDVRPRCILLENVGNIYNVGGTTVTATLADIGYDAIWLPVRAADVGAPHKRERWFCVAYPNRRGRRKPPSTQKRTYYKQRHVKSRQRTQVTGAIVGACKVVGKSRNPQPRPSIKPRLGRVAHGLSRRVDRHRGQWPARPGQRQYAYEPPRTTDRTEHRVARLRALGNAVVPQQVYPFALAIRAFLD